MKNQMLETFHSGIYLGDTWIERCSFTNSLFIGALSMHYILIYQVETMYLSQWLCCRALFDFEWKNEKERGRTKIDIVCFVNEMGEFTFIWWEVARWDVFFSWSWSLMQLLNGFRAFLSSIDLSLFSLFLDRPFSYLCYIIWRL